MSPIPSLLAAALLLAAGCAPAAPAAPEGPRDQGLVPLLEDGRALLPEQDTGAPLTAVRARSNFHDFGSVPLGEIARHVFRLRNTDAQTVELLRIDPSCGCTVASARLAGATQAAPSHSSVILSVPPGAVAEIELRVDTREVHDKNRDKGLTIRLTSSSPHRPYLVLEAHLVVDQPLQIVPAGLEFGRAASGAGARTRVEIAPVGESGTIPVGLGPLPAGVQAELRREDRVGRALWIVEASLEPGLPLGPLRGSFELRTRRPAQPPAAGFDYRVDDGVSWVEARPIELRLAAQIVPDIELFPAQLAARGKRGGPLVARATLEAHLAGQRVRVLAAHCEGPGAEQLVAQWKALDADDTGRATRFEITLEAPPDLDPPQAAGKGWFTLDDPQQPRVEFQWAFRFD